MLGLDNADKRRGLRSIVMALVVLAFPLPPQGAASVAERTVLTVPLEPRDMLSKRDEWRAKSLCSSWKAVSRHQLVQWFPRDGGARFEGGATPHFGDEEPVPRLIFVFAVRLHCANDSAEHAFHVEKQILRVGFREHSHQGCVRREREIATAWANAEAF